MTRPVCNNLKPHIPSDDLSFLHQEVTQWRDTINKRFLAEDKAKTTILFGGLTLLQDQLVAAALQSLGERYVNLPNPDFDAFQTGKAYGNRGQCNPTYFTVGNLIKYLQQLRDEKGLSPEHIVEHYVFVTAGGCGPCRFGMYITEYRKALRDAGFEGFRIFNFEQNKGIFQEAESQSALDFTPTFFITLIKAVVIGDILNILTYKIRPYELQNGATDIALQRCKAIVSDAFERRKSLVLALYRCRKILKGIKLDRLQPKAKVMIMGEFWAAMTEGDGNYNLHRFLEAEGAECIPQPIVNRIFLSIWEAEYGQTRTASLQSDTAGNIDLTQMKQKSLFLLARAALKTYIKIYTKAVGLYDYDIPDMAKLADLAKEYFPLDSDGGERHLEVAHLIESITENRAHLTISVKPFGCMPSSSVSDGIQSLVTSRFPGSNFLSIETSGEGAVNFYSRVQMALFKAKQSAKEEFERVKAPQTVPAKVHDFTYQPKGKAAGTAARLLDALRKT
jgi:predicted nucleotide-binding protein (sugar kinase/HSP70/actin superfamily)